MLAVLRYCDVSVFSGGDGGVVSRVGWVVVVDNDGVVCCCVGVSYGVLFVLLLMLSLLCMVMVI